MEINFIRDIDIDIDIDIDMRLVNIWNINYCFFTTLRPCAALLDQALILLHACIRPSQLLALWSFCSHSETSLVLIISQLTLNYLLVVNRLLFGDISTFQMAQMYWLQKLHWFGLFWFSTFQGCFEYSLWPQIWKGQLVFLLKLLGLVLLIIFYGLCWLGM